MLGAELKQAARRGEHQREALREFAVRSGGVAIAATGGAVAVFRSAARAVQCALALQ